MWTLLLRFGHRAVAAETARSTGRALPPGSWALLEHLSGQGPARVSDIAACQGVEVSSITPRLQALEAEGLIERSRDARDGRVSVIAIGGRGCEALERMHAARVEAIAAALDPQDCERLGQLIPILERVSHSLQVPVATPPAGKGKEAEE